MPAKHFFVGERWYSGILSDIEKAMEGSPEGDERQRRLRDLAEEIRPTPFGVRQCAGSALDSAVETGWITRDEAKRLRMELSAKG